MTGSIVSVSPFRNRVSSKEAFEGLELGEGKLLRPVLLGSCPASTAGLVLGSVQLAFARQGAKEQGESDDAGRRSDDSYSPRRHWCSMFKPDGEAWVRGLRTDV